MKPLSLTHEPVANFAEAAPKGQISEELVTFLAPSSFASDHYRALRYCLQAAHDDTGARVFAVTSAGPGEGKTVTTLNLAGSIARSPDLKVLVIDADVRRPSVARYLRLEDTGLPCLADAIHKTPPSLGALTRRIDAFNVSVLLAGPSQEGCYELLASPGGQAVLREARALYDYVLIDTPPILPLPDSRLLDRCVDGIVLVIKAHKTPRHVLSEALDLIDQTKVVALAFNGDDRPLSASYRYYGVAESPGPQQP